MIGTPFYHKSIKKLIATFGALFSDIKITSAKGNTIPVALHFSQKSKFIEAMMNNEDVRNLYTDITLPAMGFEITSYLYNAEQMTNPLNVQHQRMPNADNVDFMFTSVPYTLGIELFVATNTLDEAYQILEQIVPFFTPNLTVTITDVDLYNLKTNITFDLTSISQDIQYEDTFENKRTIMFNYSFVAHTKFHSNPRSIAKIKDVIITMSEKDHEEAFEKLVGHRNPGENEFNWSS